MTILILFALLLLAVVYAVFFVVFKLAWLLFKSHSNKGPLITAGVCTVLVGAVLTVGAWMGVRLVTAPFTELAARVKQNPAPVYGQRVYQDNRFPFELTVYDGMDFSKWISLGGLDLKLGIDTNAFKKNAQGKPHENFLISILARQSAIDDKDPLQVLQSQLEAAQAQRRLTLSSQERTTINDLPAYLAQGEAYSNRGKINFWVSGVQTAPDTLYYVGVLALLDTPQVQQQAQSMVSSFHLIAQPR